MNNLKTYQLNMTISANKDIKEIEILDKLIQFAEDNGYLLGGGLELVNEDIDDAPEPNEALKYAAKRYNTTMRKEIVDEIEEQLEKGNIQEYELGFVNGYNQWQEDSVGVYTEENIQNVLDGFTNEAPGFYIKTNFIELLNKQKNTKK